MTAKPRLPTHPPSGQPALRTLAMPADANPNGDIFGGWVLSQMDLAGAVPAVEPRGRIATVAVEAMRFHQPIYVGDLVSCWAEITRIGTTSITVHVQTWAKRHREGSPVLVTEGTFIYVALDGTASRGRSTADPVAPSPLGGGRPVALLSRPTAAREAPRMIDLYTARTGNGQRPAIVLEELGLPWRLHMVDLAKGDQRKPEFLRLNPRGAIPVVVDDNGPGGQRLVLAQSHAIMVHYASQERRFIPEDPMAARFAISGSATWRAMRRRPPARSSPCRTSCRRSRRRTRNSSPTVSRQFQVHRRALGSGRIPRRRAVHRRSLALPRI